MKTSLKEMVEAISAGNIPAELETKTGFITSIIEFTKNASTIMAILLASARHDNFKINTAGWLEWARDNFGFQDAHIHHLRKTGELFLYLLKEFPEVYKRLIGVGQDKLLAISRLPYDQIGAFLEKHDVENMTRDEVRAAVNEALGIKPKEGQGKSGTFQPDMFEALDIFLSTDDDKLDTLFMDERFTGETVSKYYKSGMVLVENVVNYLDVRGGDPSVIATAEHQLRAQADKLAVIRERMSFKEEAE
jgi:hypothetical protein